MSYDYWMEGLDGGGDPDTALLNFQPCEAPGLVASVAGAMDVEGAVYSRGGGRRGLSGSASCGSNYTSNVSPMWRDALGYRLFDLDGRAGADAEPELRRAIAAMRDDPEHYREMNPTNGWGDYEGALAYIEGMAEMCRRHPTAILKFWV